MDKRTALIYSKLNSYKALVNKTSGFIRWALNRVHTPYVACSFGKDSAVLLHLVLKFYSDIPVRFIRWSGETEFIDNYDDVISQWGNINLTQVEFSRDSLNDKRPDRYSTSGFDSYFVGLRSKESVPRRITLKKHGMFYKSKNGIIRISPLSDWSEDDIAAYVYSNDLPTLKTYHDCGISSRSSSRIPRDDYGIRNSFLMSLKLRDITSYQKLIKKFPEISI